jgi:hypothetical protein
MFQLPSYNDRDNQSKLVQRFNNNIFNLSLEGFVNIKIMVQVTKWRNSTYALVVYLFILSMIDSNVNVMVSLCSFVHVLLLTKLLYLAFV